MSEHEKEVLDLLYKRYEESKAKAKQASIEKDKAWLIWYEAKTEIEKNK